MSLKSFNTKCIHLHSYGHTLTLLFVTVIPTYNRLMLFMLSCRGDKFRPAYRTVSRLRKIFDKVPVLMLQYCRRQLISVLWTSCTSKQRACEVFLTGNIFLAEHKFPETWHQSCQLSQILRKTPVFEGNLPPSRQAVKIFRIPHPLM